jgi:hypothetical protein
MKCIKMPEKRAINMETRMIRPGGVPTMSKAMAPGTMIARPWSA